MTEPVAHIATNIFCWDRVAQNRALVEVVGPVTDALIDRHETRLFFDRHDARGPHLMAILSVPELHAAAAAETVAAAVTSFLASPLPASTVDPGDVATRHAAARRQPLCDDDRRDEIAPEHSAVHYRQPDQGFPFRLTRQHPPAVATAVWAQVSAASRWAIECLTAEPERPRTGLGLRLLAAFDHARERALPGSAPAFWRYFAGSLLRNLPAHLDADPEAALAAIEQAVGGNRPVFDRLWHATSQAPGPWNGLDAFVDAVADAHQPDDPDTWRLPRTLVHCLLKQLGLYQQDELPAVLYALHRALTRPVAA